jgi:hypothetical protein
MNMEMSIRIFLIRIFPIWIGLTSLLMLIRLTYPGWRCAMAEFTRTQWVDYNARDIWKPRFNQISAESKRVEVASVIENLRKVAMPNLTMYEFNKLALPRHLKLKMLDVHAEPVTFNSKVMSFEEGKPFTLRTAIGRKEDVDRYLRAYASREDHVIGDLLGYPECCIKFFYKHWIDLEEREFTWQQVGVSNGLDNAVVYPYHWLNLMYQKLGVRPYYHMPCSILCSESSYLAEDMLSLWKKREKEWLDEIFSWPVEWSALHGAAEIRTPVCKIITDTGYGASERVVQFPGKKFPTEAARGNRFPYGPAPDCWSNNGFRSLEGMTRAHMVILKAARVAKDVKSISDPGCGTGLLLRKLGVSFPHAQLTGTDINHHAVIQGRAENGLSLNIGNLFDFYSSADMVVFMPGRLLENSDRADKFVRELNFRYLLLYGYSAYADRVDSLRKQYWPDCKIRSWVINDDAVAILLEKP